MPVPKVSFVRRLKLVYSYRSVTVRNEQAMQSELISYILALIIIVTCIIFSEVLPKKKHALKSAEVIYFCTSYYSHAPPS